MLSKVLDKVVNRSIFCYLKKFKIITYEQYGSKRDPLQTCFPILPMYNTNLSNSTGSPRMFHLICLKYSEAYCRQVVGILPVLNSPTLFFHHINDLFSFMSKYTHNYADDYTLYQRSIQYTSQIQTFQLDLNRRSITIFFILRTTNHFGFG